MPYVKDADGLTRLYKFKVVVTYERLIDHYTTDEFGAKTLDEAKKIGAERMNDEFAYQYAIYNENNKLVYVGDE